MIFIKYLIFSFQGFYLALDVEIKQTKLDEPVIFSCYWGKNEERKFVQWFRQAYKEDHVVSIMKVYHEKGTSHADIPYNLQKKVRKVLFI